MSAGLSAPTEVGECRWCQTNVFSDQPRLSRGSNVWHWNCSVNEAHWLRTQLDGTTTEESTMMTETQRENAGDLCRRLDALPIGSVGEGEEGVYIANPLTLFGDNDVVLGQIGDDGDGWRFTPAR